MGKERDMVIVPDVGVLVERLFPPTDQKPTLPQLTAFQGRTQHINIAEGIGVKWMMVGTTLLDDKDGSIIPAIAQQYGNNAELINMEILRRWLQGKGIPDRTWRGLLGVLKVHCVALAESVEEVLTAEQAEQPDNPPPPPRSARRFFWSTSRFHRQPPAAQRTQPPPLESVEEALTAEEAVQGKLGTV